MPKTSKFTLLATCLLLLYACKKEPVKAPDPPADPSLIISLSKDSIMSGDSVEIRIVCKKNIEMGFCTIQNGKILSGSIQGPFDKTFSSGLLFNTTNLLCNTSGGENFTVPIKVIENPKDAQRTKYITNKPWHLDSLKVLLLDGTLFSIISMSPEETTPLNYFYLNHTSEVVPSGGKNSPNPAGNWGFIGNYLVRDRVQFDSIAVLSDTELVLIHPSEIDNPGGVNIKSWDRFTFRH